MTTIDSGSTYQLFEKSKLTSYMHGHVNSDNNKKKNMDRGSNLDFDHREFHEDG